MLPSTSTYAPMQSVQYSDPNTPTTETSSADASHFVAPQASYTTSLSKTYAPPSTSTVDETVSRVAQGPNVKPPAGIGAPQQEAVPAPMNMHMHARPSRAEDRNPNRVILDQERFLPIANVSRVMKKMIPAQGKVAKEAKHCIQESVSEFISFITSEASDKCAEEKRKTISAVDLLEALERTGFDSYIAPLKIFLHRFQTTHKYASHQLNTAVTSKMYTEPIRMPGEARPSIGLNGHPQNQFAVNASSPSPPVLTRVLPFSKESAIKTDHGSTSLLSSTRQVSQDNRNDQRSRPPQKPSQQHQQQQIQHQQQYQQPHSSAPASVVYHVQQQAPMMAVLSQPQDQQHAMNVIHQGNEAIAMVGDNGVSAMNIGNTPGVMTLEPQQMQIYVDPSTKQHYIVVEGDNGTTQLLPIVFQGGAVDVTVATESNDALVPEQDFQVALEEPSRAEVARRNASESMTSRERQSKVKSVARKRRDVELVELEDSPPPEDTTPVKQGRRSSTRVATGSAQKKGSR